MNIRIAKKIMKVCYLHFSSGHGRFYSYSKHQREKAVQKYYKKRNKRMFKCLCEIMHEIPIYNMILRSKPFAAESKESFVSNIGISEGSESISNVATTLDTKIQGKSGFISDLSQSCSLKNIKNN